MAFDKQVPLVTYVNGERVIIGTATVKHDGKNYAIIGEVVHPEFIDMLSPRVEQVSVSTTLRSAT